MKTCFPWPGSKMISPSSPAFKTRLPSLVTIFGGFLRQWTKWRKVTSIIINKIVPWRLSYVETTVICLYFFPTLCGHIYFLLVWGEFFFVLFRFSLHPLDHFPNSTFLTLLNDYEKFPFTVVWFHWLKKQATCSTIGSYHVNKYGVCEQRYSDHERPLRLLCVKVNEDLHNT